MAGQFLNKVSFSKTPQASDDAFQSAGTAQDLAGAIRLDVVVNDLGGKAKSIYSIDNADSAGDDGPLDLLAQDAQGAEEASFLGAAIWITAQGQVGYRLTDAVWAQLRPLNTGESLTDSFTYAIQLGNGTLSWATATLQIAGTNDAPVVSGPMSLDAIAEDSGARLITSAQLLANATDVDNAGSELSVAGLAIAGGLGSLTDNLNGTWSYVPALNDDTAVSFRYEVSDGSLAAAASATLDITPVNDAPVVAGVIVLDPIAENSGARLITTAQLLANATDVDNAQLSVTGLQVAAGMGALTNNLDGTWSYVPALNDDTAVSFSYGVSDGSLTAAASATMDITPVDNRLLPSILFVDDDTGVNLNATWIATLKALGYSPVYESIPVNGDPQANLDDFDVVIWSIGDRAYTNLTYENVATLTSYLNGGGNLLYAGGHDLYSEPQAANFVNAYLGLANWQYNMPSTNGSGYLRASGPGGAYTISDFSDQAGLTSTYGGTMSTAFQVNTSSARLMMEITGAVGSGYYNSVSNDNAAINYGTGWRAATWGFDINQLDAPYRADFLDSTIQLLAGASWDDAWGM